MVNFLQHKDEIIKDFCDTFKKQAIKSIWGITLNCNVKPAEEVWFNKQLLNYQILSEQGCASGCTVQNPNFVISQYATCNGNAIFPTPFYFNPNAVFCPVTMQETIIGGQGCCYTSVIVNNNSTVKTYNLTVTSNNSSTSEPIAGTYIFNYPALVDFNIQLALGGYGFFDPSTQYSYNKTTGTITLLGGLLFNIGETYTIIAYK